MRHGIPNGFIGERITFDDQTRKSMKELITDFVLDIFRKPDLSKLCVDTRGMV